MISRVPRALLYIHPTGAPDTERPCVDTLTCFLFLQLTASTTVNVLCQGAALVYTPTNQTRHTCTCRCAGRIQSTADDYLLPCGLVTNSLSLHYLAFHRTEIPTREWHKLLQVWATERSQPRELNVTERQSLEALCKGESSLPRNLCGDQHVGISCAECKACSFRGPRFVCLDCNKNYCATCYGILRHDSNHVIARLQKPSDRFDPKDKVAVKRQRRLSFTGFTGGVKRSPGV